MIRLTLPFFLLILFFRPLPAQQMEMGDITAKVNSILSSMPGEGDNNYVPPGNSEQTDWATLLGKLFAANYAGAETDANNLGYELIEFDDQVTNETYYVLETAGNSTNYWGTYIYNPNACRDELVIQAPHPKKDFNTGRQGIYIFSQIDALFYMLSGTNRCNSITTSSCDGQTSICNDDDIDEDYRISDLAHVTDAIWQVTTTYIHDNIQGTYFVQLHGFTKGNTDPYIIMSNGTRNTPNPDVLSALSTQLDIVDPTLTFEIAHVNQNWSRLIGFTNTQGRYINSSIDPCETNATITNGRFLHLEQEKSKLRADVFGWHKMAQGLSMTFSPGPCGILAALLPVEWTQFEVQAKDKIVNINWATEWEQDNAYFEVQRKGANENFQTIATIPSKGDTQEGHSYQTNDIPYSSGVYYYRLKQVDLDGQYSYSPIRSIQVTENNAPKVWASHQNLEIQLSDEQAERYQLQLFTADGKVCGAWETEASSIDLSHLPKGIYFYELAYQQQLWTGKVLMP